MVAGVRENEKASEFEKWDKAGLSARSGTTSRKENVSILQEGEFRDGLQPTCVNPWPICYAFRWR